MDTLTITFGDEQGTRLRCKGEGSAMKWTWFKRAEGSAHFLNGENKRMEKKAMPAHVVKLGKIQASVWANETKNGKRYNVTACRRYQENGEWKRSDSYGRDELLCVARAFEAAYDWIWTQAKQTEEVSQDEAA